MGKSDTLIVSTTDLPRQLGEEKQIRRTVDAPPDLAVEMIGVTEGTPIKLDLTLQSAGAAILVTGTAATKLKGSCVRCLGNITFPDTFGIEELYFYPDRDTDEDAFYVVEDEIDLDPVLREAIVLELPINPVCRPDCLGLCPTCGQNMNQKPNHRHADAAVDVRWADLKTIVWSEEQAKPPIEDATK